MTLLNVIPEKLSRSFGLYDDLIQSLDPAILTKKLPGLPSNTLGEQLWCVVGARESYTKAIVAGKWTGFACSLTSADDRQMIADALRTSARNALDAIEVINTFDTIADAQYELLIDLLEHEAAHQGQLIRYLYALRLTIPESWKSRYALK